MPRADSIAAAKGSDYFPVKFETKDCHDKSIFVVFPEYFLPLFQENNVLPKQMFQSARYDQS